MKFIVLGHATKDTEAGVLASSEEFEKMGKFIEELVKAGVFVAGEGLLPSSKGARITFGSAGKTSIKNGPFTESKELIAGFSIIQVKSLDEAIAWMSRAPSPAGTTLESFTVPSVRPSCMMECNAPNQRTGVNCGLSMAFALGEVDAVKRIRQEKKSLARIQTLTRQRQAEAG